MEDRQTIIVFKSCQTWPILSYSWFTIGTVQELNNGDHADSGTTFVISVKNKKNTAKQLSVLQVINCLLFCSGGDGDQLCDDMY